MKEQIKANVGIKNLNEYLELIEQLKDIIEKLKRFKFELYSN